MPVLLRLTIGVRKGDRTYRMGRLTHQGTNIFYVDGTPNGHHISAHDANARHPFAVIHSRLSKGTFISLPGRVEIGDKIPIGVFPSFSAMVEPVSLFGESVGMVRIDEGSLHFAKDLSVGSQTDTVILDVDALGDRFVGWFILLLRAGDWDGAERWYRLRFSEFPGYRLDSVHTWSRAEPWLGIGFVSSPIED